MIETIVPRDQQAWLELRAMDVTSTESSALFGLSPYTTPFELYHRKRDKIVVSLEENERMKWGTRLQDAIAFGIAEDQGWKIRRMDEYMRDVNLRIGASFDFAIEPDQCECGHSHDFHSPIDGCTYRHSDNEFCTCQRYVEVGEPGLLEIKNVDSLAFRDGWIVDGDDVEAPAHIEIQVQQQLAISGRKFAYIGALIGGNKVVLIKREPDEKIISEIMKRVTDFWLAVDNGAEPKPDFKRDAETIARLYNYAEPGKVFDARGDAEIASLAADYKRLADIASRAEQEKKAIKAELLTKIGDAEKILGDGFSSITANVVGPQIIERHERAGFRQFRINWPRAKKENN